MTPDSQSLLAPALGELYARAPRGIQLGLEAIDEACARAGRPERAYETVHVAGTNGKGSVSAMVESIARRRGLRTGLYTSPHLCRFAERIRIDGEPITDDVLARVLGEVLSRAPELSFFEVATLTAFVAFRELKVDLAVVEVGIGGRLDATNVIPRPRAAAITRIAFDHMDKLGNTLEEIAREKAGIAKPGLDLVLGSMTPEVKRAIEDTARARGATTTSIDDDDVAARIEARLARIHDGPPGAYQRANARVALLLGERIGASEAECIEGIARARWAGRFERITTEGGAYLIDAAHNPDGALALREALAALALPVERVALVFGALADKSWPTMLDALAPLAAHRVYVAPELFGAAAARPPGDPRAFAERHPGGVAADIRAALTSARSSVGANGLVVVCGSIYLIGRARAELLNLPRDPAVAL